MEEPNCQITLEVGLSYIPVIGTGELIKEKVKELRNELRNSFEIELPPIHLYENPEINPYNRYRILINGEVKKEGELKIKIEEKVERFDSTLSKLIEDVKRTIEWYVSQKNNEDERGKGTTMSIPENI